jgi:hypothetical protein
MFVHVGIEIDIDKKVTGSTKLQACYLLHTKSTSPKGRVPKVSTNFRIVRKRCGLLHNVHEQLIFSRVCALQIPHIYCHLQFQLERLPVRNANDFVEYSIPILIKTSTKRAPTDNFKVEPEVRDFIGLWYRTEDDVNIVEDRSGWRVPRGFAWSFTVDNDVEGKYLQVRKISKVHESGKGDLFSWLRNLSNSLRDIKEQLAYIRSYLF